MNKTYDQWAFDQIKAAAKERAGLRLKPRIGVYMGCWMCVGGGVTAKGVSPALAYEHWRASLPVALRAKA